MPVASPDGRSMLKKSDAASRETLVSLKNAGVFSRRALAGARRGV
jgi:hypothetical protein